MNGPFSQPKILTKRPLIRPLLGFSNITQEIATRIGGRMLGMMAVSSKSRLKGALVRIVIQAKAKANPTDSPAAPMPKMNELSSSG